MKRPLSLIPLCLFMACAPAAEQEAASEERRQEMVADAMRVLQENHLVDFYRGRIQKWLPGVPDRPEPPARETPEKTENATARTMPFC